MKKILVLLLSVSLLLISCTDSGADSQPAAEPKAKFHVTYSGVENGSTPEDTNEYSAGDKVTLASVEKDSFCSNNNVFIFKGWKIGDTVYEAGSSYVISNDITFTASYESKPCMFGCDSAIGACVTGCTSDAGCANNVDGRTKCDDGTCVAP